MKKKCCKVRQRIRVKYTSEKNSDFFSNMCNFLQLIDFFDSLFAVLSFSNKSDPEMHFRYGLKVVKLVRKSRK